VRGGYDAWVAEVLSAPKPPENPTAAQVADFRTRAALHAYFTGAAAVAAPTLTTPRPAAASVAAPKKGGGC
jgi:hypothetical protein